MTESMDFSTAQFENKPPQANACASCGRQLISEYFTAGPLSLCGNCAAQLKAGPPEDNQGCWRFVKAGAMGTGAGLLGAIGYGAIIYFTGYELALVTIFIGWFVGRGVMKGSDNRGGRGYQVLAAILTYVWCMQAFVPSLITGMQKAEQPVPFIVAMLIAPFLALIMPFMGDMGVLGIAILAFGVWRAWREAAQVVIPVEGPFSIAAVAPSEPT
ncbi:MAG: hypothetical protein JNM17_16500 [Archangium sp.]|nr:hypothetical protein [Archangium sp.]